MSSFMYNSNPNFIRPTYSRIDLSGEVLTLHVSLSLTALEAQVYCCNPQSLIYNQFWFPSKTVAPSVGNDI